jgi:hypothetical protein
LLTGFNADYDASRGREHLSPRIRGRPAVDDLAQCESELARQLARSGSLKVLCVLTGFEGWDPHLESHNLAFYLKHGDQIARIAIVGDERWRGEALMFAVADLRRAPVEFSWRTSSPRRAPAGSLIGLAV